MGILGSLKTMVETNKISHGTLNPVKIETLSEKMHVLKCLIHCADLSNPTRPTQLYEKWVERLMEEFFRQVCIKNPSFPVDTRRKMNVHNAFGRCPVRFLNVLCTFNLRPVSMGLVIS